MGQYILTIKVEDPNKAQGLLYAKEFNLNHFSINPLGSYIYDTNSLKDALLACTCIKEMDDTMMYELKVNLGFDLPKEDRYQVLASWESESYKKAEDMILKAQIAFYKEQKKRNPNFEA